MPWTVANPPPPAKNWTAAEKAKCTGAANAVLADGGSEKDAIFACIRAAGKSKRGDMSDLTNAFLVPTSDHNDDVLIFPIGKFYRDEVERQFTREDGELMVRNFKDNVIGRLPPVNREHKKEAGRIARIADLWLSDDGVRGKVEPAEGYEGALKAFDFVSPEIRWQWTHPTTGETHKNVLFGAAATNYPFFLGKMALHSDDEAPLMWNGNEWEAVEADHKEDEQEIDDKTDNDEETTGDSQHEEANTMSEAQEQVAAEVEPTEDYTEMQKMVEAYADELKALKEQFAEVETKLDTEREKREKAEENFAESERKRKLLAIGDVVEAFAMAAEPEKFAEDMLEIQEMSLDVYDRILERFRAADEQIRAGGLFEQYSSAAPEEGTGDPYLNKVEQIRKEDFGDLEYEEGFAEAMEKASKKHKDLARDYARRSRGGQ